MSAVTIQAELISDDPRRESEPSGFVAELRDFLLAQRELRGLLTSGQAAKILGVHSSSIGVWVRRGRLTGKEVLGVAMVSAAEVLALHRQRVSDGLSVGGRGSKASSISDLADEAWREIDPFGE